jgi:pimeloyl-ACP methyl ester carboxylesterase
MANPPHWTPALLTVTRGDVRLVVESQGDSDEATILLLAGTSCTRDWWPPTLCAQLAALGARVIRFDQRDTGASTTWPVGEPTYGLAELAADALAILDAVGAAEAHLVGFSQGGWVAQLLALDHPDRVASLTLVSTRSTEHGPADADLPEVDSGLLDVWATLAEPDWSDSAAVVESYIDGERILAGESFDEDAVRSMCEAAVARSTDARAAGNHPSMRPGERWRERLGQLQVPTTVIHGTVDPLFPVGNARALAAEIPGAELHLLHGVGHELPAHAWGEFIDSVAHRLHPS